MTPHRARDFYTMIPSATKAAGMAFHPDPPAKVDAFAESIDLDG